LVINPIFNSTISALPNSAQVEAAFDYAAQQFEGLFSNNMTVNITVGTTTTGLGHSYGSEFSTSFSTIYGKLAALSTTPDQVTSASYLPTSPPISGSWEMPWPEGKALGLVTANDSHDDGAFAFNGTNETADYTFDPFDRAVSKEYDFIGIAEHEVSELLGRTFATDPGAHIPNDLFRYLAPGAPDPEYTTNGAYFSIDGGNTNLKFFNNGSDGGDPQDWAVGTPNSTNDSFNDALYPNEQASLSNVDVTAMDVLGYNRTSNLLTWNGGTHDPFTDSNWSTPTQPGINPHFGAFLYMDTVSAAIHSFTAGENFTLASNSDLGQTLEVSQGSFIMEASGAPATYSAGLLVNQDGIALVDTSGSLIVAGPMSVGDAAGVTNALAEFYANAAVDIGTYSGGTQVFYVGNLGTGSAYQYGSSSVTTPTLIVGESYTGVGSYYVSNTSRLYITADEVIGDYGLGSLTQNGGTHTINGNLYLASHTDSKGTLTLNGGTLQDNGSAFIAGNGSIAGGVGNLYISGGAMTVNGALTIYEPNGNVSLSSGSLTVGTLITNNDPYVFNWTGGTLHLTGQPLDITGADPNNDNPLGGYLALGSGQTLQVDSTESLSGTDNAVVQKTGSVNACSTLQIGSGGNYNLSGGTLSASEVDLNAGGTFAESSATVTFTTFNQTGGSATFSDGLTLAPAVYNLSGGTLATTGSGDRIGYLNLATGVGGAGTFNQTGGTYTTPALTIGLENTGTFNLGKFGILNVTGAVNIGELSSGSTFTDDGTATLGTLFVFGDPQTTVTIDGGSLTSGSTTNYGTITQTGGSSNLGALTGSYGILNVGSTSPASKVPTQMVVAALQQGTVNIQTQGLLKLTGGTDNTVNYLTINSGYLDLTNSQLFINTTDGNDPIASIAAWITSGYNHGAWNGTGIMSSNAQTNSGSYGIGYADSADPGNPAGLAAGQIEIMYTLLGDATLDGKVNGTDFNLMAANFNKAVTNGWDQGDFNYDGKVNGSDFILLADNFNQFASQSAASAADLIAIDTFAATYGLLADVPEPMCTAMITLAGVITVMRPRRSLRPRASQTAREPSAD
jgi:hypothetical protein